MIKELINNLILQGNKMFNSKQDKDISYKYNTYPYCTAMYPYTVRTQTQIHSMYGGSYADYSFSEQPSLNDAELACETALQRESDCNPVIFTASFKATHESPPVTFTRVETFGV